MGELLEASRKESGCIRYNLVKSDSTPNEFWVLEEWKDNEAFAYHLQTEHDIKLVPLLEVYSKITIVSGR